MSNNLPQSAILYQNATRDVFLLDIPTSITLAQRLALAPLPAGAAPVSGSERDEAEVVQASAAARRALLSSPALKEPYPAPPEPKTPAARARVLERISISQREFYDDVAGSVERALGVLNEEYGGEWCLPRCVCPLYLQGQGALYAHDGAESNAGNVKKRKKKGSHENGHGSRSVTSGEPDLSASRSGMGRDTRNGEPFILGPSETCVPELGSIQDTLVRNPWPVPSVLYIKSNAESDPTQPRSYVRDDETSSHVQYIPAIIPPRSCFVLSRIMTNQPKRDLPPILPLAPCQKFDFILMDPPWSNRSARRSSHYSHLSTAQLGPLLEDILNTYLSDKTGIAGIWITNSEDARSTACKAMEKAGLRPLEEWVWVKTTLSGEPVVPLHSLWRKPYEVLVLGCRNGYRGNGSAVSDLWASRERKRRVIAAVPDVHSRKPNLKELVEKFLFTATSRGASESASVGSGVRHMGPCDVLQYSALEVFARNLTAGWSACGDEVLRFNWAGWWTEGLIEQDSSIR